MLMQHILAFFVCSTSHVSLFKFNVYTGRQKRPCYYGSAFIATKSDVDCHIKNVYAKAPRSKVQIFYLFYVL